MNRPNGTTALVWHSKGEYRDLTVGACPANVSNYINHTYY